MSCVMYCIDKAWLDIRLVLFFMDQEKFEANIQSSSPNKPGQYMIYEEPNFAS